MVAAPYTAAQTRSKRGANAAPPRVPCEVDGWTLATLSGAGGWTRPSAVQPQKAGGVGVRSSSARCNASPPVATAPPHVATQYNPLQRHHTTLQRSSTRCNAARRSVRVAPTDLPVEEVVGRLDEERAARGLGVGDVERDCAGTHAAAECGSTGIGARRGEGLRGSGGAGIQGFAV